MSLDDFKRLQRKRLTGHTAQLIPPPPKSNANQLRGILHVAISLRQKIAQWWRDIIMPLITNPDGSASIVTKEEYRQLAPPPKSNLPAVAEPAIGKIIPAQPSLKALLLLGLLAWLARWNWPLVAVAFGLYAVEVGTNVRNAWNGDLVASALPLSLGVVVASGAFFLPCQVSAGHSAKRIVAACLCVFFFGYALHNTFQLAATVAADQAQARADRSTTGTEAAGAALAQAQARVDRACAGVKETQACRDAKANEKRADTKTDTARADVAKQAKPAAADFVKMVAWISGGYLRPTEDDFGMLGLFLRMVLPLTGGLVLALARR
jgi:hypothetical protein